MCIRDRPQINDMERRLGIMQSVEPVLENAIKTLQKVVDVRGMGKKAFIQVDDETTLVQWNDKKEDPYPNQYKVDPESCWPGKGSFLRPGEMHKDADDFKEKRTCKDPCDYVKKKEKEAEEKAEEARAREKHLEVIEAKKEAKKITDAQEAAEEKATAAALDNDEALKKEASGAGAGGKVGVKPPKKAAAEE